jgi:hypothetical protein
VDNELSIDLVFKVAGERGLKPRVWTWKPLQHYNGYASDQRILKWQALCLAIAMGLIPPAGNFPCDICGTTSHDTPISYHSENYDILTEQYPLCRSCHALIHTRHWKSKAWRETLSTYGDGSKWYEHLR